MTYLLAFCLSFVAIFGKGIAQQNTQYKRKALMIPTSFVLASAEMMTAGLFVKNYLEQPLSQNMLLICFIAVGGGLGCMLSLDFHSWLTKKIYKW